jgi:Transposase IS66 family
LKLEAVRRIDSLFDIERDQPINGHSAEQRLSARQELSTPLFADLERWLREQRPKLSRDTIWPRPWTTCSSGGRRSPTSSPTVGFACRTTPPSAP